MTSEKNALVDAALEYAAAHEEYSRQWKLNRESEKPRNEKGSLFGEMHTATEAACVASNVAADALLNAAKALATASLPVAEVA